MPHLIIQHSDNITIDNPYRLLNELNKSLWQSGEFKTPEELKSRIIPLSDFLVGIDQESSKNQPTDGFIFLHLKIMSGRDDDIKQQLAKRLAETTKNILLTNISPKTQICVEIEELSSTYHKILL